MDLGKRLAIGSLGALTPILANLLVVDYHTTLANLQLLDGLGYAIRLFALCASACVVVYLNNDEDRPIKIFQLGIAAPALLTGIINGAAISAQKGSASASLDMPAFISRALAEPAGQPAPAAAVPIVNCLRVPQPTATQQVLKGLIGIVPDNQWFVVVGSYRTSEPAIADAREVARRYEGRFKVEICQPVGGTDSQYRVVIGEYLSYNEAAELKLRAINAGVSKDSWIWNPFDLKNAIR